MLARLLIVALLLPAALRAQDDLKPLFDAFAKERAAAKGDMTAADKLAAKAEDARKAESFATAARLIRDARWALPAQPKELPEGVRVFGYNRLRHDSNKDIARVNAVRYNRDGTLLLSCSNEGAVRVWDVATGREAMVYRGHALANSGENGKGAISGLPLRVADAIFLPDGERVASIGGHQIHIWNLKTGQTLKVLEPKPVKPAPAPNAPKEAKGAKPAKEAPAVQYPLKCLAVSDDGKRLAGGSDDMYLRVWNLESGEEVFVSTKHSSRIEAVAWQPKGKFVAVVDTQGLLSVYNPSGENKNALLKVQVSDGGQATYAVRFTPDGTKILTGGADGAPRLTPAPGTDGSVPPNAAASTQKLPAHKGTVQAVGVTPDGRHFIAGGKDHKIRIVDALGEVVRYYEAPSEITALDVRPDGHQIATACEDGTVRLWDFVPYDDHRTANEAKEPLWAAAVNADGTAFATAGADKIVRVYSPTGKLLHALEGSTAAVTSLAFLPENKLISAGGDKLLRLWDAKAGKPLGEWPGHTAAILALAATPDGRVVVSGTADKIVNGWNAETGKVIWTWTARSAVAALAITKDAKRVLVGTADGGLSVLSIDDGKVTLTGFANAHVSGVAAITFNADESAFASVGGDGIPKIWTLPASGPPLMALRLAPALVPSASSPVALSALAFSPDGRQIAVGGADKLIRLYDAKTGAELRNLRGCTDWITALAFSPGGDRLLAVSADKVARIFDVARIDPLAEVGHSRPVRAVAVSPDGQQIASVGEDRMIRLWNRATGAEVAAWPCSTEKDTLLSVCFAGPYLVTGGKESSSLTLWDRASKKEVASASIGQVFGLTPSADGKRLGVWSRSDKTDTYSVYDLPNLKQPAAVMVEKGGGVSAATFASNLSFVATGDSTGRVVLSDFTTKAPIGKPLQLQKKAVCVSRIVAGPGRIVLPFFSFVKSGKIADLGLSEDMQTLIAIDELGALYLVKLPSREFAIAETGRKEGIGGLLVAPRGRHVALFVSSPEIFIYDFAGKEVKKYALPSTPNNVAWTPDGKTLVTANADGSLYVMDVP